MTCEYGIVANVAETDRLFRSGAKAWLAGGNRWRRLGQVPLDCPDEGRPHHREMGADVALPQLPCGVDT